MKIKNFIAALLPTFGTDRVLEDCRITKMELKEVTLPSYDQAALMFKGWKFKSEIMKGHIGSFNNLVKSSGGDNMFVTIQKSFKDALINLDQVESLIEKTYSQEVAGGGFTYLKANLLQFVECMHFVSKYARKFLIYTYIHETAQFVEDGAITAESLTPAEQEWITANFINFCSALNVVSGNPGYVKKAISEIPDVVITSDNASTMSHTIGEAKLDPFQMSLIPIWLNPIYHVRMFVAEWQADRYKVAKEELKLLQLRKLNLEKLSEGKQDAAIQKQIEYMEGRIASLNYKIQKVEKEHG